jgi:hypothetical protein
MGYAVNATRAKQLVIFEDALFVCAYEDEEKCDKLGVPESISMSAFRAGLANVQKSHPLVFFCT